jgi:hypothetical protein
MPNASGTNDESASGATGAAAATLCRNCGASVDGKFCPQCGQETELRLPTLREFLREAAGRYVALDGRLWRTVQPLVMRPGFLTREYLAGRRRRYIRPARLYLFSTLIFFAVSRFFVEPTEVFPAPGVSSRDGAKSALVKPSPNRKPEDIVIFKDGADPGLYLDDELALHVPPALAGVVTPLKQRWQRFNAMPRHEKEDHIFAGVLRYGPYAMFALLPAFALLLKLVYVGRRRRYPLRPRLYGEHMVFAAHNHAFVFIMATAMLLVPAGLLGDAIAVWICAYLLWAMRSVYGGSKIGVAARASLLLVTYAIMAGLATAGLVVAAILLG